MALKRSFTGRSKESSSDSTATPIMIVKITILNISPLTIDAKGFSGSKFDMASGIFSKPNDNPVFSEFTDGKSLCSVSAC